MAKHLCSITDCNGGLRRTVVGAVVYDDYFVCPPSGVHDTAYFTNLRRHVGGFIERGNYNGYGLVEHTVARVQDFLDGSAGFRTGFGHRFTITMISPPATVPRNSAAFT